MWYFKFSNSYKIPKIVLNPCVARGVCEGVPQASQKVEHRVQEIHSHLHPLCHCLDSRLIFHRIFELKSKG